VSQQFWPEMLEPWRRLPRTLLLYTCGGLIGASILTILHITFPPEKPAVAPPEHKDIIHEKVNPPHPLSSDMQVSVAGNDIDLIRELIENQDKDQSRLEAFTRTHAFEVKYPLGFALFYSDGDKILSYVGPTTNNISFDPSNLVVTIEHHGVYEGVCLSVLPVAINGQPLSNFSNNCFAGVGQTMRAARIGSIEIDIEPLGTSAKGAAWVIGMKQAE
jgi:hypothetical protein